jgi:hypothetical protein
VNESQTAFVHPATKKRSNRRIRTDNSMAPETPGSPSATFVDPDFPALGPAPGKLLRGLGVYSHRVLRCLHQSCTTMDIVELH